MKYTAVILTAILAPTLAAQEAEPLPSTLQEEMSALNVTMKKIAALLEKHVAGQETELLIKRVDLTNRALISRREELAKTRREVEGLTEEGESLRSRLEAWHEGLSQGDLSDEDRKTLQFEMERLEKRLIPLESRRKDQERRVIELENDVMAHEENMQLLEDVLDDRLGLR